MTHEEAEKTVRAMTKWVNGNGLDALRMAADALRTVARLPVTRDGVRMYPGIILWQLLDNGDIVCLGECDPSSDGTVIDGGLEQLDGPFYSTEAAAKEARDGQ